MAKHEKIYLTECRATFCTKVSSIGFIQHLTKQSNSEFAVNIRWTVELGGVAARDRGPWVGDSMEVLDEVKLGERIPVFGEVTKAGGIDATRVVLVTRLLFSRLKNSYSHLIVLLTTSPS